MADWHWVALVATIRALQEGWFTPRIPEHDYVADRLALSMLGADYAAVPVEPGKWTVISTHPVWESLSQRAPGPVLADAFNGLVERLYYDNAEAEGVGVDATIELSPAWHQVLTEVEPKGAGE